MKGCLKWAAILGGIFIVVSVIIVVAAGGGTSQTSRPARTSGSVVQVAADSPTATPTPEWMAPSYDEICDNNDTMTDLQQEDYAASMAGKKVVGWVGKVYDVESGNGGLYTVQVEMVDSIISARDLEILGVPRDIAVALNVEQQITFSGTIKSVDMFMGNICNPINVIEATITPS
jgi:hypothetical protein